MTNKNFYLCARTFLPYYVLGDLKGLATEEPKVTVRFIHPDKESLEYQVTKGQAMELEILAITKPPKRLMKTIDRVIESILMKQDKGEVGLDLILGPSRSGDIYNALKYLEIKDLIERRKDIKIIKILSEENLKEIRQVIKSLL